MNKAIKVLAPVPHLSLVLSMLPINAQISSQKIEIPSQYFLDEVSYDSIVDLVYRIEHEPNFLENLSEREVQRVEELLAHLAEEGVEEDNLLARFELQEDISTHLAIGKPSKEIEKSIKSFEKLIVEHSDKIKNPSKFIPDWETLHPERKNALINKKWPAEIKCYSEQKHILENFLNKRVRN